MTGFPQAPAPLNEEAESVLLALAGEPDPLGLRLNDLAAITELPTGHVGRHLRTLEAHRLASFGATRWRLSLRGRRMAAEAIERATPSPSGIVPA